MAGPWEKYSAPQSESGPWAKYGAGAPSEEVVNEAHPELSSMSRLVYKNLGTNVDSGLKYLQKENPTLDFKADQGGEVLVKKPTENQWRKLDPSGIDLTSMKGINELGMDIGDVAYDIPAAVIQGAATAGGGLIGAGAGAGAGAIPGAMVGSGASSAALEAARQGLGKYFGVNEELDPTQIGIAGGAGLASPLLFGSGATAAQIAKQAAKTGASETTLLASQRGIPGRAYDAAAGYLGPKLGSLASGINEDVIKTGAKYLPEMKRADVSPDIVVKNLQDAQEKITTGLTQKSRSAGQTMERVVSELDANGVALKTADILDPVEKIKEKIKKEGIDSEAKKELITSIDATMDKYFKVNGQVPEQVTASQANSMYFELKELAKKYGFDYGDIGTSGGALGGVNRSDARIAQAFKQAGTNAKESIKSAADEAGGGLGEMYSTANSEYGRLASFRDEFNTASKSEESFSRFLGKVSRDPVYKKTAQELSKETGVNLRETMLKNEAFKKFANPSKDVLSLGGTTSTSRTIPLALAGGAAGYAAAQNSGGEYSPFLMGTLGAALGSRAGSPAAIRKLMDANKAMRSVPAISSTYKSQVPFWTKMLSQEKQK